MYKPTELVRSVFQLLLWAAVAWLLYTVRAMIVYLIIAAVLTLIGKPIVHALRRINIKNRRIPLWVCSILTIIAMILVVTGISLSIIPGIVQEATVLASIDFSQVLGRFQSELAAAQQFLTDWDLIPEVTQFNLRDSLGKIFTVNTITKTFNTLIGSLGNVGIAVFSIIFILFFFLKEAQLGDGMIRHFVPDKYTSNFREIIPKIKQTLTRYFVGIILQLSIVFILVYLGLNIIGINNAIVIALFAAMMNIIPYVGPFVGSAFGVILGMGQILSGDPNVELMMPFLQLVAVFSVVQAVDNNLSQPIIFSKSIHAHPLEIFIVISIAGTLAGFAGMIIAVPFYSVLRIIAKAFKVNVKFIRTLSRDA